ncbi:type-F conjugative transfer system secretin TraK [Chlamydiales bacterium]|nr:type-F conjugative transfer system secretin TraK [Chlamydiales bacterium]
MLKTKGFFLTIFTLFFLPPLFSTLIHTIDTDFVLPVEMSSIHQNRIYIKRGKIIDVIFPEGQLEVTLDRKIGQVFVYSLVDFPKPTTISIVTEKGVVQDISIVFCDKEAEIISLIFPEIRCSPKKYTPVDGRAEIAKAIISGHLPKGFGVFKVEKRPICIKGNVFATPINELVGVNESIYLYVVENGSRWENSISESDFCLNGLNWVYIEKASLKGKEKTLAIVSVKKDV